MVFLARNVVVFLIILVLIPFLQWFLSRSESRVPGLVMPVISFLFSFVYLLNFVPEENGFLLVAKMIAVMLLANIPTFILLAIYFAVRSKKKKKSAVDKMNIQDL